MTASVQPLGDPANLIARAQQTLEGVTEGPWEWDERGGELVRYFPTLLDTGFSPGTCEVITVDRDSGTVTVEDADADFIAAARTLVPELVAALKAERRDSRILDAVIDGKRAENRSLRDQLAAARVARDTAQAAARGSRP